MFFFKFLVGKGTGHVGRVWIEIDWVSALPFQGNLKCQITKYHFQHNLATFQREIECFLQVFSWERS